MGAQTLEILRQGVWASITGGWFYDPHQNVFCNTFHFYLWILLLCFPFTIYLCFPLNAVVYCFYCGTTAVVFIILKLLNHALHHMFDTCPSIPETVPLPQLSDSQRNKAATVQTNKTILEEEGIELQVLKTATVDQADDESLNSVDGAPRVSSSTIDLKVDVHRKNSSESSEEARAGRSEFCGNSKGEESPESRIVPSPAQPKESRKRNRSGFLRNLSAESQNEIGESNSHSSGVFPANGSCGVLPQAVANYDLGITANGSCGLLPQSAATLEQMKNTGSLELPLKETSDKGLLYWKQQNLESSSCCDKLRKVDNVMLRVEVCSELSIVSDNSVPPQTQSQESALDDARPETLTKEEEEDKKYLEEEFEWFAGEYGEGDKKSRIQKFKSDDNIRQEKVMMPCLKFQVNSDEDSSDNGGSRSPLLCRHESLEKASYLPETRPASDGKTTKSCPTVGNAPFTVYLSANSTPIQLNRWSATGRKPHCKRERREAYLQGPTKLSLPQGIGEDIESSEPAAPPSRHSADVIGLDWLFEDTDSETECRSACLWKYTHSEDSDAAVSEKKLPDQPVPGCSTSSSSTCKPSTSSAAASSSGSCVHSLGAIPKTQVVKRAHKSHRSGRSKRASHSSDGEMDWREKTKQKNERENGIIDEEQVDVDPNIVWLEPRKGSLEGKEVAREAYDSSSGSATELSSLLPLSSLLSSLHAPSSPLLAAFLATRRELPNATQMPGIDDGSTTCLKTPRPDDRYCGPPRLHNARERHRRAKRVGRCHRPSRSYSWSTRPVVAMPSVLTANTHIATSYNDTSQGAVHCFQDEEGVWWSYIFDSTGRSVIMQPITQDRVPRARKPSPRKMSETWDSNINLVSNSNSENESSLNVSPRMPRIVMNMRNHSVSTNSSSALLSLGDSNNNASAPDPSRNQLVTHPESLTRLRPIINTRPVLEADMLNKFPFLSFLQPQRAKSNHYYKFYYTPWNFWKVRFDRIELMALLDRNLTVFENLLSLFLSVLVSICGILLLSYGFYRDIFAFLLCLTIAGCHYSLLKSVQPDASSPTHGYNRVVIYSRAIYFCMIAAIIMGLSKLVEGEGSSLIVYSVPLASPRVLRCLRDVLTTFLLFFPVLFTLGLFPQINTFALYLIEQIDIHIFGGNASCSLFGALYCLTRSVLTVFLIFGFAYGALSEEKQSQHILFSIFCTLVVTWSYHLSRSSSDPTVLWNIVKDEFREKPAQPAPGIEEGDDFIDPLPGKLKQTVHARLINDVIVCSFVAVLVFGIHCSAVFTTLQPDLNKILWVICGCSGLLLHYLLPHLRKQLPWLCLSRPVLRSHEHGQFEVRQAAKVMWFEEMLVVLCFLERNVLYPVLVLSTLTHDSPRVVEKFGLVPGALLTAVCGLKIMRSAFSNTPHQYLIVVFSAFLFVIDYHKYSETFLLDYFLMTILFAKAYEFLLKIQFVVTYIAPWQITWGSAFHAFAQPFAVPHSPMLFAQAAISAILSAPLNPFLGSAIFMISYVRPVKFWERDYNTKRVDQSNTRLSSHLDRNLGSDDNNLNSIFYEHLTRSLQHSLCGDLQLGRWGPVSQGDCFVLASDYLNCLVHIIEVGNGLVTFQMRGLEFRGTYCQQREVEAITEGVEENDGCCCCEPGHMPHVLSVNAAFSQRWLAWEVTATNYVLEGYSISDNSAVSMLQVFDFRKVLVTYYVKGIIWYCIRSARLDEWLSSPAISSALANVSDRSFVDLDPVFNVNIDLDFEYRAEGITRSSFCNVYLDWIQFCASKREKPVEKSRDSPLVSLCLALSLMGRRTLAAASHNTPSSVDFFLYGFHALFKGDFRITSDNDEWVFSDMELLKRVVAPAVRMSLKLHQDHFMSPDEYEDNSTLYNAITKHDANLIISHEGDPAWRSAVLSGTPSLLALRHVVEDNGEEYKVIMLNKRFLSFRVIKLNRECVRGLWAGQQQELVFLRNRNPERGSIQNAKQALRNMINSSCDQPIGYPIYVSPLTTSYSDTNHQLTSIIGGSLSLQGMKAAALKLWTRVRHRCRQGCSSGGSVSRDDPHYSFGQEGVYAMSHVNVHSGYGHSTSGSQSMDSSQMQLSGSNRGGSLGRSSLSGRSSFPGGKPSSATLVSLAGLLSTAELAKGESFLKERETSFTSVREQKTREDCTRKERSEEKERRRERRMETEESREMPVQRVRIIDPKQVFDSINLGRRIDVMWPDETMRTRGGRSFWKDWVPDTGMEGLVVHRWTPNHRDQSHRSHVDKNIVLVKIGERFVPIGESGVQEIPADPLQD